MLARPATWRGPWKSTGSPTAIQLHERVNEHYLTDEVRKLGTRTMRSLVDEIHHDHQQASWQHGPRTLSEDAVVWITQISTYAP
jgi:hypothetical protein